MTKNNILLFPVIASILLYGCTDINQNEPQGSGMEVVIDNLDTP